MLVEPLASPPDAIVRLPGSKSITNRALVAAGLASGRSTLTGVLLADDTRAMLECLRVLGVGIDVDETRRVVDVTGADTLTSSASLDARRSGTTARFVLPVVALAPGRHTVDGDPQLRGRPMAPLFDALRRLGATVEDKDMPGHLPAVISGPATGGRVDLPGHVSSQFLSGLLLAGPRMAQGIAVHVTSPLVSRPYVTMTEKVMAAFGVDTATEGDTYRVSSGAYGAATFAIEPDASAASYFFAAAVITGGRVRVDGLSGESVQGDVAFVDVLERMGAVVRRTPHAIEVVAGSGLHGVDVDLRDISDTAPTLAVVAPFADSPTRVRGIGFVRRKESDRIAAVITELRRCGVRAEEEPDGFVVHPGPPHAAVVSTYDDHRIAMSFALFGLVVPGFEISDPQCVAKTFPDYFDTLDGLRR